MAESTHVAVSRVITCSFRRSPAPSSAHSQLRTENRQIPLKLAVYFPHILQFVQRNVCAATV